MLTENEQVKGETFKPTDRIKLYVVEVKNTPRGPKILVSRTHPELVKRLFEAEVAEVRDGTVENQEHCPRGRLPYEDGSLVQRSECGSGGGMRRP